MSVQLFLEPMQNPSLRRDDDTALEFDRNLAGNLGVEVG
jgi:hypothetical protein